MRKIIATFIIIVILTSCLTDSEIHNEKLMEWVTPAHSNITFNNKLIETDSFNYFKYPYFYMGGGVAVGDINNDGLQDLFFTGNQVPNQLYLNKGNLEFDDISHQANVKGQNRWYTGVTFCDVNTDGYLDIYLCVSGKEKDKKNELYINNNNLTFTESAQDYGIADDGASIQAVFFDFDNDNDLDLYVANYPFTPFNSSLQYYKSKIENPTLENSDRLYENKGNGKFADITVASGILNFGLTLGVMSADFNNDGFQDIYISNDFATPDFFYLNNGDGTFKEIVKKSTNQTSFYGMGIDIADINNDALLDMIQLDMNPPDNKRSKENMASMNPERFDKIVDLGFHHQYMHNVLQLNQGTIDDSIPIFSNISQLAGIASTDWSWASLFADFDNDGWKDLYITNGSRKDVNNKDFFEKLKNRLMFNKNKNYFEHSWDIPSEKLDNYMYKNNRDLTFTQQNKDWGVNFTGFSNGAAYADLDNDGDLEILINNIDSTAVLYKNNCSEMNFNNYLRFRFVGPETNPLGVGVKVKLQHNKTLQYQELALTRGFQSSVEPILHFGTEKLKEIDTAFIIWPDGKTQLLNNVKTNQILTIFYKNATSLATSTENITKNKSKLFEEISDSLNINFVHNENIFDDYQVQPLLPHKYSNFGPALAVGDINNDGLDDFYVGGAAHQSGSMYVQRKDGNFELKHENIWEDDKMHEDIGATFFDADGDGDLDLYVASGGYEFEDGTKELQDRLYINYGKKGFEKHLTALPKSKVSSAHVIAADYDGDGDQDLFVGGRVISGKYPYPAKSSLLENITKNGKVVFEDVTRSVCPPLDTLGLVTSAVWRDFDGDSKLDLIVVGEWMPITFFKNTGSKLVDVTKKLGLSDKIGWWYSIASGDFDRDGDLDFIVGNLGLNYKYKASKSEPFEVYAKDFDRNGSTDIVLGYYDKGHKFPVRGKQCSAEQIPMLEMQFPTYNSFASASLSDIYGEKNLKTALHYTANKFESGYLENIDNKTFKFKALPSLAQVSSINSIVVNDFDSDGKLDALVAGNLFSSEVETPRNDAGNGLLLKGNGDGSFEEVGYYESGFLSRGDTKHIRMLRTQSGRLILVAENNDKLKGFINTK